MGCSQIPWTRRLGIANFQATYAATSTKIIRSLESGYIRLMQSYVSISVDCVAALLIQRNFVLSIRTDQEVMTVEQIIAISERWEQGLHSRIM